MKSILLSILLVCCSAVAQPFTFNDVAFMGAASIKPVASGGGGGGDYPTNITGYPALTWHVGADYNSSTGVWNDRSPNGWHLYYVGTKPGTSTLDSQTTLTFNGSSAAMQSIAYQAGSVHEVVMLVKLDAPGVYAFDSTNSSYRHGLYDAGGGVFGRMNNGFGPTTTGESTSWVVLNVSYTNSNGGTGLDGVYTNKVGGTFPGTDNSLTRGFTLGARFSGSDSYWGMQIAEMVTYETNLTTSGRSGLYDYWKAKYPSASLP